MSAQQYWQTVGQFQQEDDEARRMEEANAELQRISAAQDDEFRASLQEKYPQLLAAWPGRNK